MYEATERIRFGKTIFKGNKRHEKKLMRVEAMLTEERLTPKDWKDIEKAREEIRKGKYLTLEQLKKELRIK